MKNLYYFVTISVLIFYPSINAQWVQTDGPYIGDVCTFANSGTNLFAGTTDFFVDSGGVFLSTNNGTNWIATGFQDEIVSALVIDGLNLFAGTPNGIFLSTNNGTIWTDLNVLFGDTRAFAISGANLFAGTYGGGVYRSTNNGTSWTVVNNGLTDYVVIAFAVSGTNIFAGTYSSGVFLSTNNGSNWAEANSGLMGNHIPSLTVNDINLFAGSNDGVFLSTNNGTNWIAASLQDTLVSALTVFGTISLQGHPIFWEIRECISFY